MQIFLAKVMEDLSAFYLGPHFLQFVYWFHQFTCFPAFIFVVPKQKSHYRDLHESDLSLSLGPQFNIVYSLLIPVFNS